MTPTWQARTISHCTALIKDILNISWALYKIMIPTIIVIKILESIGGVDLLSALLAPLMHWLDLPEEMALVWATTLLTNIYAGMLVFFTHVDSSVTVAQVSVISGMLLIGHGLPVEVIVARNAGVRLLYTLLLRIGGGIAYGAMLHMTYKLTDTLNQPAVRLWEPETTSTKATLWQWGWEQLQGLAMIFLIIAALLTLLRIFKIVGIERFINYILSPVLRLFNISRQASTITLVGFTLGLSFGGGMLINEAKRGHVSPIDIFAAMTLIGLSHSMIEDTFLVLLLGAHVSAALWLRLLFTLVVAWLVIRWARARSKGFQQRYLLRDIANKQ